MNVAKLYPIAKAVLKTAIDPYRLEVRNAPTHPFSCPSFHVVFVLLTLISTQLLRAQTFRGGINGTVTDTTGAAIAQATLSQRTSRPDATLTSISSSGGEFLFNDLPLGTYTITVSAQGFATAKVDKVMGLRGRCYTLPVKLSISSSAQTIEVDAAAVSLDTTTVTQDHGAWTQRRWLIFRSTGVTSHRRFN